MEISSQLAGAAVRFRSLEAQLQLGFGLGLICEGHPGLLWRFELSQMTKYAEIVVLQNVTRVQEARYTGCRRTLRLDSCPSRLSVMNLRLP